RSTHQPSGLNHSRPEDKRDIKNHAEDQRGAPQHISGREVDGIDVCNNDHKIIELIRLTSHWTGAREQRSVRNRKVRRAPGELGCKAMASTPCSELESIRKVYEPIHSFAPGWSGVRAVLCVAHSSRPRHRLATVPRAELEPRWRPYAAGRTLV